MTKLLARAIACVRTWLGLDPARKDPQPSHGWLLPHPSALRAGALERALRLEPVLVTATTRRDRR
jgi:hypothetical protein